jgi:hypothetical protein
LIRNRINLLANPCPYCFLRSHPSFECYVLKFFLNSTEQCISIRALLCSSRNFSGFVVYCLIINVLVCCVSPFGVSNSFRISCRLLSVKNFFIFLSSQFSEPSMLLTILEDLFDCSSQATLL